MEYAFEASVSKLIDKEFQKHHEWAVIHFYEKENGELHWAVKQGQKKKTLSEEIGNDLAKLFDLYG